MGSTLQLMVTIHLFPIRHYRMYGWHSNSYTMFKRGQLSIYEHKWCTALNVCLISDAAGAFSMSLAHSSGSDLLMIWQYWTDVPLVACSGQVKLSEDIDCPETVDMLVEEGYWQLSAILVFAEIAENCGTITCTSTHAVVRTIGGQSKFCNTCFQV